MSKYFSALILSLVLFGLTGAAQAQTAKDTALEGAQTVLGLISDPLFADPASRDQIMPELEQAIRRFVDFEEFSSRAVGALWRQFSPEQKERFQIAITKLLEQTYIDAMLAADSKEVSFADQISSDNDTRFEVRLNFTGEISNTLAFRLMLKSGQWVVYDIIVEGVSLVSNYREQFRSLMVSGSAEDLISRVEARAAETR